MLPVRIPRWAEAVLSALRFPLHETTVPPSPGPGDAAPRRAKHALAAAPAAEPLGSLTDSDWERALAFCDRHQLTLLLGHLAGERLPDPVRGRIESNFAANAERYRRTTRTYQEIAAAFQARGIESVLLKGFTQWPEFIADPRLRMQYDLDLFCPADQLGPARDTLLELRYEPVAGFERLPTDHLPVMIRRSGWRWRGDYFDPEIPLAVDLHFRLWDEETERFRAPGVEQFWTRRCERQVDGLAIPVFHPADALGYSALHVLRHLLRASLRLCQVFELAYFLEVHSNDEGFWNGWRSLHPERLRVLETICFRLAAEWFGGRLVGAVREEIDRLPACIQDWFERYAASPLEALFHPNKNELWLHLCLLDSLRDKGKVLRRRLLPMRLPGPVGTAGLPESQWRLAYLSHLVRRAVYHLRVLPPALWRGLLWWTRGLGTQFWIFLGAVVLFSFGTFILFLLYNLFLLDLGFREDFLGLVAGATSAGNIAGALPAGALGRRVGLRTTLLGCFALLTAVSALRVLLTTETPLLVLAFLSGAAFSTWAVSVAPLIARLTREDQRPLAFSVFFSSGIGAGIVAGLAGGRLPGWLATLGFGFGAAGAKRAAMLIGCALSAAALIPVARLRFTDAPQREGRVYPRSPFLLRFLAAIAVWNLAVGSFNPFFNAYFSRYLHTPVERIGAIFSGAQLAQVLAVLAAPAVFKRLGLVAGIAVMQLAAGAALGALAASPAQAAAAVGYIAYMAAQWMSEPGLFSLLMNRIAPAEQQGASALNYLVVFSSQAIAGALAGAAFARFGYPPVLAAAAGVALSAGLLFRRLLR